MLRYRARYTPIKIKYGLVIRTRNTTFDLHDGKLQVSPTDPRRLRKSRRDSRGYARDDFRLGVMARRRILGIDPT